MPSISVALPIYNAEATLGAALDSILEQSHTDFEILAVDDGSDDATPDILADYAVRDSRLVVIRTPNRGIVSALNTSIAAASGRCIARMDGDDICHARRFAKQFDYLERTPHCVAVGSQVLVMDRDGAPATWQPRASRSSVLKDRCRSFAHFPPSPPTVPHPTAMIRLSAFEQVGGYRRYFASGAEDRDLWWRLMAIGEIHCLTERLLRYRSHVENRSHLLRDGAVADALVSDLSAIARHYRLSDELLLESYSAARAPETLARYADLLGDRYPVRALVHYRATTRKIPELATWIDRWAMRREILRHLLLRPNLAVGRHLLQAAII